MAGKKKKLPSKKTGGNVDKFKKAFSDANKKGRGTSGSSGQKPKKKNGKGFVGPASRYYPKK